MGLQDEEKVIISTWDCAFTATSADAERKRFVARLTRRREGYVLDSGFSREKEYVNLQLNILESGISEFMNDNFRQKMPPGTQVQVQRKSFVLVTRHSAMT